jgi:two-component system, OmpR family, phosphate regulon sensor histidine kinase PhoR
MKKNSILILGVVSMIILVSIQYYIIRGVWQQKDETIDLRYKTLAKEAIDAIYSRFGTTGYDTALYLIDNQSIKTIEEILPLKDTSEINQKKKDYLNYVNFILTTEEDLSVYLSDYFDMRGYEKNFNTNIEITFLELIDFDKKYPVYSREGFRGTNSGRPTERRSRILIDQRVFDWNNFRIRFDFFIDFTDKQDMILKETSVSLALSTLSILVVVIIFLIAYKDLLEEKRLSDLKTDFINNMTHELKTPLSTITVAGRTLEMEQIRRNDAKILETAKLIGKQSVHLNQLINLILEISMWERTQFELDKKNVDIEELLNEITDCFKAGLNNGAEIKQEFKLDGVNLNVDVVYFTTMINNLLSNAVKYSVNKSVILLEAFRENNNVIMKVTDNGIGISKTDQKHIFDKFYRVSHGNIHKFKGLGLGLYYVKKIAEAHGGNVAVSSKLGKGTTFIIILPTNN